MQHDESMESGDRLGRVPPMTSESCIEVLCVCVNVYMTHMTCNVENLCPRSQGRTAQIWEPKLLWHGALTTTAERRNRRRRHNIDDINDIEEKSMEKKMDNYTKK